MMAEGDELRTKELAQRFVWRDGEIEIIAPDGQVIASQGSEDDG